jgi:hypothetical protein
MGRHPFARDCHILIRIQTRTIIPSNCFFSFLLGFSFFFLPCFLIFELLVRLLGGAVCCLYRSPHYLHATTMGSRQPVYENVESFGPPPSSQNPQQQPGQQAMYMNDEFLSQFRKSKQASSTQSSRAYEEVQPGFNKPPAQQFSDSGAPPPKPKLDVDSEPEEYSDGDDGPSQITFAQSAGAPQSRVSSQPMRAAPLDSNLESWARHGSYPISWRIRPLVS